MATRDSLGKFRFNVTRPWEKITGAVALERERVASGERREKHLALEYFCCFAVDDKDRPFKRSEVERVFKALAEREIERVMIELNAAIQEEMARDMAERQKTKLLKQLEDPTTVSQG